MELKDGKQTQQLNLRMPKELLEDIDLICDALRVNKSEWIKIKLGEVVYQEKTRLFSQGSSNAAQGMPEATPKKRK